MKSRNATFHVQMLAILILLSLTGALLAQPRSGDPMPPRVISPEVAADRHVTFRILALKAETVRLTGSDIPGMGRGADMTKDPNGVWEVTLGPIDPGAYRYNFNVDDVSVIDPRNPKTSESNMNTWTWNSTSPRPRRRGGHFSYP